MSQTCHPASWPDTMWIHGTRTRKHFQAETTAVHNDDDVPMVGSTIEILWETDRLSPDVSLDEGTWWRQKKGKAGLPVKGPWVPGQPRKDLSSVVALNSTSAGRISCEKGVDLSPAK